MPVIDEDDATRAERGIQSFERVGGGFVGIRVDANQRQPLEGTGAQGILERASNEPGPGSEQAVAGDRALNFLHARLPAISPAIDWIGAYGFAAWNAGEAVGGDHGPIHVVELDQREHEDDRAAAPHARLQQITGHSRLVNPEYESLE